MFTEFGACVTVDTIILFLTHHQKCIFSSVHFTIFLCIHRNFVYLFFLAFGARVVVATAVAVVAFNFDSCSLSKSQLSTLLCDGERHRFVVHE